MRIRSHHRPGIRGGFMFIELLIVIGILGMLAAITVVAINPSKHLCETNNAKRRITEREISNAVNQYEISTFAKAAGGAMLQGEQNARPICAQGVTNDVTCVNLDVLVPEFILELPKDIRETNASYSGYGIFRMPGGMDLVKANHLEDCLVD